MSDFTIEQLEALKEGTTPGPWEVNRSEIGVREIVDGEVDLRYLTTWEGEFDNDNDAELAAAAPSLADALIAEKRENQSIRAELEEVLDIVKHETWLHDDEGQFPETVQLGSYVAGQLTLILEADHG